jgi:hypothetical protein
MIVAGKKVVVSLYVFVRRHGELQARNHFVPDYDGLRNTHIVQKEFILGYDG